MTTCRICLRTFNKLKFFTEHIAICGRCVNTLNESPELAKKAEERLSEMLARGMRRNAERDLTSDEEWKQRKAEKMLNNFDSALAIALPVWINKLLAKPENSGRDYKIMRAHRRGLLRMEGSTTYPSRSVWAETAHKIRIRDGMRCAVCQTTETILDVHHIVYLSKHGTNQQSNLITLCRGCHEREHDREFDLGEIGNIEPLLVLTTQPEAISQLLPDSTTQPEIKFLAPQKGGSGVEMQCPHCLSALKAEIRKPVGQRIRCPKCSLIFLYDHSDARSIQKNRRLPDTMPAQSTKTDSSIKKELKSPVLQPIAAKTGDTNLISKTEDIGGTPQHIANEHSSTKPLPEGVIFITIVALIALAIFMMYGISTNNVWRKF
jgi:hypothetical protein